MMHLLLAILCSVGVAQLLKAVDRRHIRLPWVFAANYLTASVLAFITGGWVLPLRDGPILPAMGVATGVLFIGTFFIMAEAIRRLGVIIPVSLMRLSSVLPTIASIVVFAEAPTKLQVVGLVVAFSALPFAGGAIPRWSELTSFFRRDIAWGFLLFICFGMIGVILKVQRECFPLENEAHFLAVVFPTAMITAIGMALKGRHTPTLSMLGYGTGIGLLNFASSLFIMKAIHSLPGIIVYPANAIGVILVTAVTSFVLWREKPQPVHYVFLGLAVVALVLLSQ